MNSQFIQKNKELISYEIPLFSKVPQKFYQIRNRLLKNVSKNILVNWLIFHFIIISLILSQTGGISKTGKLTSLFLGLSCILSIKNSPITLLTGIRYEVSLKIHRVFGLYGMLMGMYHAKLVIKSKGIHLSMKQLSGFSLLISIIMLISIGIYFKFSKKNFNTFMNFHKILFVIITINAYLHQSSFYFLGVFFVVFDLISRAFVVIINDSKVLRPQFINIGQEYVKIIFTKKKPFNFQPGQYFYLFIPQITLQTIHPFSIASSPFDQTIQIIIKRHQNFTNQIFNLNSQNQKMRIFLDGPYGGTKIQPLDYEYIVFIGGGIGITPLLSICSTLLQMQNKLKKIDFYHSNRNLLLQNELRELEQLDKQNILTIVQILTGKNKRRFDIRQIVNKLVNDAKKQNSQQIAIFASGPIGLIKVIEKEIGFQDIHIDFNYEEFDLLDKLFY